MSGLGHKTAGDILEHLGAEAWFADREKVLRWANRAGRSRQEIAANIGQNIEGCHKPESVAKLRRLYDEWEAGSSKVAVYSREVEGGRRRKRNVLVPVHGPEGFRGVVELVFVTEVGEA
ncbi:MAG: hypothetical protein K6U08_01240 [Firmicutes bacterium]|nr:hypothetical protein [Bacillota bacterium]